MQNTLLVLKFFIAFYIVQGGTIPRAIGGAPAERERNSIHPYQKTMTTLPMTRPLSPAPYPLRTLETNGPRSASPLRSCQPLHTASSSFGIAQTLPIRSGSDSARRGWSLRAMASQISRWISSEKGARAERQTKIKTLLPNILLRYNRSYWNQRKEEIKVGCSAFSSEFDPKDYFMDGLESSAKAAGSCKGLCSKIKGSR